MEKLAELFPNIYIEGEYNFECEEGVMFFIICNGNYEEFYDDSTELKYYKEVWQIK